MTETVTGLSFEPGPADSIRASFQCAACRFNHETYFLDASEAERFANQWKAAHDQKEHGGLL